VRPHEGLEMRIKFGANYFEVMVPYDGDQRGGFGVVFITI